MKEQFTVYIEPDLMRALTEYAERRGKPKSLVAEAAIASFLSPDASERQEAALTRRLDRITRQMERLERDVGISVETIALFIRFWLMATPTLPEQTQAAARTKGTERYESFIQALGRRLAKGPSFIREISLEIEATGLSRSENAEDPAQSAE
ncbi:MAG: CopG family transcriptional regulator [Beijerinckiaceae bacterium]|nr:CopG family transcriptional regulator [Beijerinckiaceae bacterium]